MKFTAVTTMAVAGEHANLVGLQSVDSRDDASKLNEPMSGALARLQTHFTGLN